MGYNLASKIISIFGSYRLLFLENWYVGKTVVVVVLLACCFVFIFREEEEHDGLL